MHKFLFFVFFALILWTPTSGIGKTAAYFSPGLDCESQVIQLIECAEKKIDVAIYTLTNGPITEALIAAHKRGIKIRILADKQQAANKYATVTQLHDTGLNVRVHTKHRIEHNKFMVVDGDKMITGSYNWTESATWKNSENCLVLWEEPETVERYQKRFEYLWTLNTHEKSERWFLNNRLKTQKEP